MIRRSLALALAAALATPATAADEDEQRRSRGHGSPVARHSLRAPVTDENFYFIMADRFENGTAANDLGGLPADPMVSGFDPTARGFYHGGDLRGILRRLD